MKKVLLLLRPLLFVALGLMLGAVCAGFAGEDPINVMRIMVTGAWGSTYDIGLTLYYTTLLICTGLAVAVPFRAGVFNIGGEGQALAGAMTSAVVALMIGSRVGPALAAFIGLFAAILGGFIWGGIIGWIRAYRGGHEVISSIMMNFIASGLTAWLTLNFFRAQDSQNPETSQIDDIWRWSKLPWFAEAPVTMMSICVLVIAILVWFIMAKTRWGFAVSSTQQSPAAAQIGGIDVAATRFWSLAWGGGLADLAGGVMVLASSGRFRLDMSEGFGFMGIPVALLAKGHPLGVVASSLLFASLHQGASALDLEAVHVNRDLAQVVQALVVMVVVGERLFSLKLWRNLFEGLRKNG